MIGDPNNNDNLASFNREAYKHAISMIESNGGKNLSNPTSSAAGKYHFLYNLIKKDPDMRGISYRKFVGDPDLQEKIMEKALNGKLAGYAYGEDYAKKLIAEAGSDKPVSEIAALVHFLGSGGTRDFLKNPDTFQVPGTNLTGDQYLSKFKNYYQTYLNENKPEIPKNKNISSPPNPQIPSERKEAFVQQDGTAVRRPVMKDFPEPNNSQLQSLTSLTNEFKSGGDLGAHTDGVSSLVTLFEAGGTHEENPMGGIPQGIGSNGKPNLVEEGETKWDDYIFSNSIGLDGSYELGDESGNVFDKGGMLKRKDGSYSKRGLWDNIRANKGSGKKPTADMLKQERKINKKEEGGELNPTNPTNPVGPVLENPEGAKYPMKFTKTKSKFHDKGRDVFVEDERNQYIQQSGIPLTTESDQVNFDSLVQDEQSKAFLDRYNNPWARNKMKEQTGLSDYDIDNMIIKGLKAEKQIGGNVTGSKASYDHREHVVHMGKEHADDTNVETHERVHASAFDAAQGRNLVDVLGNSFQQGESRGFLKKFAPDVLRYLNMPHEAYGNFVEFREKIGLKPGEQITVEELKKRVKKSGASMENFYRGFNDENIVKALNTIAYQENDNDLNKYKIT